MKPTPQVKTKSPPVTTDAAAQKDDCPGRHFDAASFVGGIVLSACVIAIVFFVVKFYKSRTENRYHQF